MWRLSFAAIAFLTIGLAAEGRDTRTSQAFELKRIIEAIQPGTGKGAVEEALKSLALPYRQIFRREFHSDSATWMVEPLPDAAVAAGRARTTTSYSLSSCLTSTRGWWHRKQRYWDIGELMRRSAELTP
jgi:hypothetical protein